MDTVVQRQNITNAQKYTGQMMVSLQTNLLVASKVANATVATAQGQAQRVLLASEASATIYAQNGAAEAEAFSAVKHRLGLSNAQLLRYVWWDAVGSGGSGSSGGGGSSSSGSGSGSGGGLGDAALLVGVSPTALVQQMRQ